MRDFEYEPKVVVKRKGGFLGKFVAFLLGIIFGVVGGLGGVAYAGYYVVTKMKIDDAVNTVNGFSGLGFDYTQYISGEYGQKTVYDLVGDAYTAVMNIATNSGTLQDLDDISPLVYDMIAGKDGEEGFSIVKFLQAYEVEIDADKMMDLIVVKPSGTDTSTPNPDVYLMDYLMECAQKMPAPKLFEMLYIKLNPLLDAILNGVDGDDPLSVGGLMGADLITRVYSLPVSLFLENLDKNDTLMMTLVYGPAYRYTISGSNVEMNQVFYTYNVSETKLYDGDGNDVTANVKTFDISARKATIEINGETQYLQASTSESTAEIVKFYAYTDDTYGTQIKYKETTVADLTSISDLLLNTLTLNDVLGESAVAGNDLLKNFGNTKIKDLPEELKKVTIGDLVDTTGNPILTALKDETFATLPNKIDNLYVRDVMDVPADNLLLNAVKDTKLSELAEKVNNLKIGEMTDVGDSGILHALRNATLTTLEDELDKVQIANNLITPDTDNAVIMYLLYGKENVHYEVDGNAIKPLQKRVKIDGANVYNAYNEKISGATVSGNTYTVGGVTYYLTDASATLGAGWYYVYTNSARTEKWMYSPTTIADLKGTSEILDNVMNRLTITDVMGDVSDNKVLCHLADVTIGGLSEAIHSLTIEDVFEQDMYEKNLDGSFKTDASGNRIMKHTWEYMLLDPTTGNLHHEYTLEDNMNDLMGNFQKNVQHRSLKTLISDRIIELEVTTNSSFLNKNISIYQYNIGTSENPIYAQTIGDLTISQMIDFMSSLIP